MRRFITTMMLVSLPLSVIADEVTNFDFEIPSLSAQSRASKPECKFDELQVPKDAIVYAAGGYAGRDTGFQIDQSGHSATQFDIAVNSPSKPVILMLGAYEPTIWNLGWSDGTRILAVLASGYHRQVVAGLNSDVPLLISSYDNRGPCGYFYVGEKGNSWLNPKSRALFGKPVELIFLGDKSGKMVIGEPLAKGSNLVTSSSNRPESYQDPDAPLAGQAGIDEALSKGLIRRATVADANRWVEALVANTPEQDIPPIAGLGLPKPRKPSVYNGFVVLKKFTYPAGLYGARSVTFFIGKGVPKPDGNPGHSVVYDFNTLSSCLGPLCRY
jgi:hypothetical protein